jgi:hypothetical protein
MPTLRPMKSDIAPKTSMPTMVPAKAIDDKSWPSVQGAIRGDDGRSAHPADPQRSRKALSISHVQFVLVTSSG